MRNKINIGIIGCGYWGPNLIRNFSGLNNCNAVVVSDFRQGRLDFIKTEFPFLKTTLNYKEIIDSPEIDAVCIATPVTSHASIAIESLNAGKHVFIEKPMTSSVEDSKKILEAAERNNRKVAVGHVFQFAPAVRKIKEVIDSGLLGEIFHITSSRINLGPPKTDVDVIWDLGPHDFSILLYLLNEYPCEISSVNSHYPFGFSELDEKKLTNNSHIDLKFNSGITAHIHLSWLSSNKTRLMCIYGSKGTIIYDEMLALDGKIKLFDKGIDNRIGAKDTDSAKLTYKAGDIHVFELEQHEPLRMECAHFIDAIIDDTELVNNGKIGMEVVKIIDKVSKKLN